jgi:hypothetical protein
MSISVDGIEGQTTRLQNYRKTARQLSPGALASEQL